MAISGFFGRFNITRLDLDLSFPVEIYAKRDFPVFVNLTNRKHIYPVFLIKVKIFDKSLLFPFFEKRDKKYIILNLEKRGKYKIEKVEITSSFPFNFFVRVYELNKKIEFIVFPEPKKFYKETVFYVKRDKKGDYESSRIKGYEGELISIKDYIEGTPLKYVDWKSSAKTGLLKIKEFSSLIDKPIIIDFESVYIKNLEDKLSFITYLIVDSYKKNIPVGLKINGNLYKPNITLNHKLNILRELALYEKV